MKKVFIIIGSVIIILAVSLIFGYKFIKQKISPVSAAIYAVPIDAAFVFQTGNIYELVRKTVHESIAWQELIAIPDIKILNSKIEFLDSLFRLNLKAKEYVKNRQGIISGHLIGEERLEYLFTVSMTSAISADDIHSFIASQLAGKASVKIRNYTDVEIYEVQFAGRKNMNFYFALKQGIFILSFSSLILENSIRQLDTQISLFNDRGYRKVQKTAGQKEDANIFINFKEFSKMLLLSSNKANKDDIIALKNYADWSLLDLNIKKDSWQLNGFTYTNDSSNNYLNVFLKQKPLSFSIPEILPANTSVFLALNLSDLGRFNSDYRKYIEFSGQSNSFKHEIGKIKKETNIDIEKMMYSIIDKEIAVVFTDVSDAETFSENSFAVVKTGNRTQAEEEFSKLLSAYASENNVKESSLKETINIDEQNSFVFYKMPYSELFRKLFGSMFAKTDASYFTFLDNYIVFGKTNKALESFVHYKILQKTLNEDKNFKQFNNNMTTTSTFYFYSNISRSTVLWSSFFNDEVAKILTDNTAVFQKYQALAFQFSSNNDMLYNNICVKYNPVYKDEPRTVWDRPLDTITTFRPVLVDNIATEKKCIFVQDLKNNVYLINNVGTILWKIDAKEKIMSNVYQIDYFKNKKIQFLFSSQNYIHLIDIMGNYVKQFPVKLRVPASNGVTLTDNDKKKAYKYFIAGTDKKIYAYSKEGNILKDWKFKGTDNIVKSEIQFFNIDKKEYVVFSDVRKTYITDRKGIVKINPDKAFNRSVNNIFYLKTEKNQTGLVTTDTNGIIKLIDTDGKVSDIKITQFSANHYFIFDDINNEGSEEYIFADQNRVDVYKENKALLYSRELDDEISEKPVVFNFTKKTHKLGVVSRKADKIYLLNNNGSLYNGFPLAGSTMFSIGYFSRESENFNLVVGSNDHFIYNYEIK